MIFIHTYLHLHMISFNINDLEPEQYNYLMDIKNKIHNNNIRKSEEQAKNKWKSDAQQMFYPYPTNEEEFKKKINLMIESIVQEKKILDNIVCNEINHNYYFDLCKIIDEEKNIYQNMYDNLLEKRKQIVKLESKINNYKEIKLSNCPYKNLIKEFKKIRTTVSNPFENICPYCLNFYISH